jgi:hypothetical protein
MGTDYPFDMADPNPVCSVTSVPGLSEADRNKILGGNATRLLRLKPIHVRKPLLTPDSAGERFGHRDWPLLILGGLASCAAGQTGYNGRGMENPQKPG